MQPTLFISDLHLAPARPAMADAFLAFCEGAAREANALYILGDLFDAWIGDDQLNDRFAGRIAGALNAVARNGTAVAVMHGNRDLLLGQRFAQAAGATLLPEQIVVDLHGTSTLLLHGDELCTDDVAYQRFRQWARDPKTQRWFLAAPYVIRRSMVAWMRRRSRMETANKPEAIMDVNADAVKEAFRTRGVARMIHGHTHRPAHHEISVDGQRCERIVLPDWCDRGGYLEVDAGGARTRTL